MIDPVTEIDFPFFQNQLTDMFGDPRAGGFAPSYLRVIDLSEFAGALGQVLDYEGNPWKHRVYGNWIMAGALKKAFGLLVGRGLAGELKTFDGCFNIRAMKSSGALSVHSWGLALDFNAATNPFTRGELITDFSEDFILCFAQAGFEWGGTWQSVKDAMHFQLPWNKDWQKSNHPLRPVPYQA